MPRASIISDGIGPVAEGSPFAAERGRMGDQVTVPAASPALHSLPPDQPVAIFAE